MDNTDNIKDYFSYLKNVIDQLDINQIDDVMNALMDAYEGGNTIYIFGNGGSSATASHIVCDYNKGVSLKQEKKFRMTCLNDNMPVVMAIANDCGFEHVFKIQMEGKITKEDYVFAISGSGNSKNVIEAVEYAKNIGCKIITMTGYDGGKLLKLSDYPIHVNIHDMQKVEDVHMIVSHLMAQIIAKNLGVPLC